MSAGADREPRCIDLPVRRVARESGPEARSGGVLGLAAAVIL
jgi:hypothetical protein